LPVAEEFSDRWPKFNALCETCRNYGRYVELHVGGLKKDAGGNTYRELTTLTIGTKDHPLLSQRIPKGNLDRAAELIQKQLGE